MTASPEQPNLIYVALENAARVAATSFCHRYGCTRLRDIPNMILQETVQVPCGTIRRQRRVPPSAVVVAGEVLLRLRCGVPPDIERDCLNSEQTVASFEDAVKDGRAWAFRRPRFYEIYDRPGGRLLARGAGY